MSSNVCFKINRIIGKGKKKMSCIGLFRVFKRKISELDKKLKVKLFNVLTGFAFQFKFHFYMYNVQVRTARNVITVI